MPKRHQSSFCLPTSNQTTLNTSRRLILSFSIDEEMKNIKESFTVEEMDRMANGMPPWKSMSFACGGWLQFYMFGVGKAIQVSGLDKGVKFAGCSAGALAATGLALGGSFDDGVLYCKEDAVPTAYSSVHNLFKLHNYVGGSTDRCLLPHFDLEKLKNLEVSVTKLPFFTAERASQFTSPKDLKDALLSSCAAFPVSNLGYRNGSFYIDGGFTDFQPVIDENTITVSPFYFSDCDIKPSRYVPLWWAFLPPNQNDTIDWLYGLGYEDGMNYVKKRNILQYLNKPVGTSQLESVNSETDSAAAAKSAIIETTSSATPQAAGSPVKKGKQSATSALKSFIHDISAVCRLNRKASHPYDTPRKVSMHRFLGYDLSKMTNNYFAFFCDLFLLFLLICVWKPMALSLIYFELLWRVAYLTSVCALSTVGIDGCVLYKLRVLRAPNPYRYSGKSAKIKLYDCIHCVLSLSLLLRFISGRPSSVELRKHDRLAKHSILYRVFRHII